MLNDSLRCKYQLSQITKTKEKKFATSENCIPKKMDLKFQNPNFNMFLQNRILEQVKVAQ